MHPAHCKCSLVEELGHMVLETSFPHTALAGAGSLGSCLDTGPRLSHPC